MTEPALARLGGGQAAGVLELGAVGKVVGIRQRCDFVAMARGADRGRLGAEERAVLRVVRFVTGQARKGAPGRVALDPVEGQFDLLADAVSPHRGRMAEGQSGGLRRGFSFLVTGGTQPAGV
ncbi:MAG: hypothetical protein AMXMBFR13_35550 [Phycisphaerae bacterium]